MNKLESSSPKDALCQVEIDPVVLEKILNIFNIILLFCHYLPLKEGVALHLYKLKSRPPKGCFVPSFVEIGPVVLENKIKM